MPKMKTHSGAKKRFTSHILEKKSAKRKRALGAPALLSEDDTPRIKRMLGAPSKSARKRGAPASAPTAAKKGAGS